MYHWIVVPQLFGEVGDGLFRVARQLGDPIRISPTLVESFEADGGILLIAPELPARIDLDTLLPMGANVLKLTPDHCLLIPFGSGESAVRAAAVGIPLARKVGLPIVFYHTAWRKPDVENRDGWSHITPEAMGVSESLRRMAARAGLADQIHFVVETADTVVDGLIRTALVQKAALIIMARGDEVRVGSYVDQLAAVSPVPLLIAHQEIT